MTGIKKFFKELGPGMVTGAADDDPSGIATYTQTGAQFGYGQLWTAVFMLPMLIAIQEACARIGAVNESGLAAVIKKNYSKKVLYCAVLLVLVANIINIGADIGAMAASFKLLVPINLYVMMFVFTIIIVLLEVFVSYKNYAKLLKWLTLSLLAYPITVFIVAEDWGKIISATFLPHIEFNFKFLFIITGVLGTTISPYLFFWQASQESEEARAHRLKKHDDKPVVNARYMKKLRRDNFSGMLFSEITTWSIILVAASELHKHGITDVKTASDAAKALQPFAGNLAKSIFAIGIIGLGMISVPVLAGSAAYAVGEMMQWKVGLNYKLRQAKGFYGVIIVAILVGLLLNFVGIDPFKALVYCAVINGVVAVPMIFIIALIAGNEKIMGKYKSGKLSQFFVWLTFAGMALAAVAMFFTLGKG